MKLWVDRLALQSCMGLLGNHKDKRGKSMC